MSQLRSGFTTGTAATAAAKAAALLLAGYRVPHQVQIHLPDGTWDCIQIAKSQSGRNWAEAAVQKDAGDDPDVTHGAHILVRLEPRTTQEIQFAAGEGVGTVTLPGLALPAGQPAVNPVPRQMISKEIRGLTHGGMLVTISVPNGKDIARRTCNPRLGILGGISILGTTGRVRPFSTRAVLQTIACSLNVAKWTGVTLPVLVPGHMGERCAKDFFNCPPEHIIEVGNAWDYALGRMRRSGMQRAVLLGHPGKLAKLAAGHWNTHSSRSPSALGWLHANLSDLRFDRSQPCITVEAFFAHMDEATRKRGADRTARAIHLAVWEQYRIDTSVFLTNLQGLQIGGFGAYLP